MIQPHVFKFLKDLKKNNEKTWFDANRKQYENAKADFQIFVSGLIKQVATFDPTVAHLTAKDCMFRINRDVRFSKDKSPYKTNFGTSLSKGGKKVSTAGYYLHIEPSQCFIAGGLYMPDAPQLAQIRQEIDYNFATFKKIVTNKTFTKYFASGVHSESKLSRPPKGYDDTNPAIEFLKLKGFIVTNNITDAALQDKNATKEIAEQFAVMKPLIDFLNAATENV
jgi:uncharacterized protein (TIGR02453 family)